MTKKNVAKTLEERMVEAFKMGHNYGVSIHSDIDVQQGEVRVPRELSGQSVCVCVCVVLSLSGPYMGPGVKGTSPKPSQLKVFHTLLFILLSHGCLRPQTTSAV